MITTRLYLDVRYISPATGNAPIKLQITKRGKTAMLSTGIRILPDQWDKPSLRIVRHPARTTLNTQLAKFKIRIDEMIMDLVLSGRAAEMSVIAIKDELRERLDGTPRSCSLVDFSEIFLREKSGATAGVYQGTLKVLERYCPKVCERPLISFTPSWCAKFASWLSENYSGNTRNTCLFNLSAIFNRAVSDGLVRSNPFKGIKRPYVVTKKRCLTQQQFRSLWNESPRSATEKTALDLFRLSFLTIASNPVDIASWSERNVFNGRIEYDRSKTKKHYSVKIVPEAAALLEEYKCKDRLFASFASYGDYHSLLTLANKKLAVICGRLGLPAISLYWARHSWATFAAELDIPIDIISAALGHSHGARVTMVYVALDQKKIDDAARKVIDYALYSPLAGG
jgi:Phage integrase family.